jgi:hypothetical protein
MMRQLSASALVLALGACNNPTDLGKQRIIGAIDPSSTSVPVIVAPAEVEAQAPFSVVVHTYATLGCSSPDGQDLSEQADLVRIVPYDIVAAPGHTDVCTSEGIIHEHRFNVELSNKGEARLRVVGSSLASRGDRLDSVEVAVSVR